ncbi:hypothetical protein CK203_005589 [Vitis vinifera]|uniref:Uncharacterized protein n=1 Tax=Vitis vinifera TaxID=29760 RepID=A0A438K3N0_VITVI|nr:hypothetical protein CK203_005589 [Vitis vinifera]
MERSRLCSVEKKPFQKGFVGEIRGTWISISKQSKDVFSLGFQKRLVKEEGPKSPGFVPVKRWAKEMVFKCLLFDVDWTEIGQALAATLG